MVDASSVAYAIAAPGGITSSSKYARLGFRSEPEVFLAGPDSIDACFVGTVDEGVIVSFRGTLPISFESLSKFAQSLRDFMLDGDADQVEVGGIPGRVHHGFAGALNQLWDRVVDAVERQLDGGKELFITGHSKGAAIATLAAIRLMNLRGLVPAAVYPFASTRVGDGAFAAAYDAQLPQTRRYANRDDIIPHLPLSANTVAKLESFLDLPDDLPEYAHVKTLQFIGWNGQVIDFGKLAPDQARAIQRKRVEHLVLDFVTGRVEAIAKDHEVDGDYSAAVCG